MNCYYPYLHVYFLYLFRAFNNNVHVPRYIHIKKKIFTKYYRQVNRLTEIYDLIRPAWMDLMIWIIKQLNRRSFTQNAMDQINIRENLSYDLLEKKTV